jgi:hypothetical protein
VSEVPFFIGAHVPVFFEHRLAEVKNDGMRIAALIF